MTIKEIYEAFDKIGCLTFTTVNRDNEPESRIAHLRAYDDDGLYFMTMFTKQFYHQLKETRKVAVCGLCANSQVDYKKDGTPVFDGGYFIRMTGNVKEVSIEEIKSKNNPIFNFCIKDQENYNAMVVMCITSARGDIFDYDFEKVNRGHKLERKYFSYNGENIHYKGLSIDQNSCIRCGKCEKKCSFNAVEKNEHNQYGINRNRCDECGDCYLVCPVKAISYGEFQSE